MPWVGFIYHFPRVGFIKADARWSANIQYSSYINLCLISPLFCNAIVILLMEIAHHLLLGGILSALLTWSSQCFQTSCQFHCHVITCVSKVLESSVLNKHCVPCKEQVLVIRVVTTSKPIMPWESIGKLTSRLKIAHDYNLVLIKVKKLVLMWFLLIMLHLSVL